MSGAEPCTGSNSEGNARSGFRFALGASPIVPVVAGPRSERMSPNRLDATTTSKRCGCSTKRALRMSMCCLSTVTSGYCAAIASARSRARELEGEPEHAVGAQPGEHRLLDHDLAVGALEQAAAEVGVFALGV